MAAALFEFLAEVKDYVHHTRVPEGGKNCEINFM